MSETDRIVHIGLGIERMDLLGLLLFARHQALGSGDMTSCHAENKVRTSDHLRGQALAPTLMIDTDSAQRINRFA